jgi:hypothetical protein
MDGKERESGMGRNKRRPYDREERQMARTITEKVPLFLGFVVPVSKSF